MRARNIVAVGSIVLFVLNIENPMLEVYERISGPHAVEPDIKLSLTHEQRSRARLKATSTDGQEVGLFLEHGNNLKVGEYLSTSCGKSVRIDGALETVMSASCDDWFLFSRACYHLGNRHVKLQIAEKILRISPDHVLKEMLESLGMTVREEKAVFIPENGAYYSGKLSSAHSHSHSH